MSEDRCQRTEDRCQRTDVRGQMTEDRGRRTDVRDLNSEVGMRKWAKRAEHGAEDGGQRKGVVIGYLLFVIRGCKA